MDALLLHRNFYLVPGRRRSTWQVSTAYRARAGQSRKRRRKNRQDQRVVMSALAQVKSELRAEWDALMADLHRVMDAHRVAGRQTYRNPYIEYGMINPAPITVMREVRINGPIQEIDIRGTVECD